MNYYCYVALCHYDHHLMTSSLGQSLTWLSVKRLRCTLSGGVRDLGKSSRFRALLSGGQDFRERLGVSA